MIIALVNQKGGVGKTTVAVHLTHWLAQKNTAIIVDADAQHSSSTWLHSFSLPYQIISDPEDLFDQVAELSTKYDAVVIDAPGSLSEMTRSILLCCDLALIPCRPTGLDLNSANKILRLVRQIQKARTGFPKTALFLSQAVKQTLLLKEARATLEKTGFILLQSVIYFRQSIADAPGQETTIWELKSKSAKEAAQDFQELFVEALEVMNDS